MRALTILAGIALVVGTASAGTIPFINSFWSASETRGALVNLTATDSDPAGSDTIINFDAEVYDRTGWHDNVTNNSRVTVPSGVSLVRVVFGFDTNAAGPIIKSFKNGAAHAGRGMRNTANVLETRAFSPILAVTAGDYFEFSSDQDAEVGDRSYGGIEALPATTKYALVNRTSNLSLTTNVFATVGYDSEVADTDGWHDNVTNNSRLTVPSGVSLVRVSFGGQFSPGSGGSDTDLFLFKNGLTFLGRAIGRNYPGSVPSSVHGASTAILEVTAGDYFTLDARTQATGSPVLTAGDTTWFSIEEVPSSYKRALVRKTSNQTVTAGVETAVTWDAEIYDTDSIHDNSTNNSRLTVPAGVTQAKLTFNAFVANGSTGHRIRTFKNGAAVNGTAFDGMVTNSASFSGIMNGPSTWLDVTAGDYFEMMVTTGTASTSINTNDATWFAAEFR